MLHEEASSTGGRGGRLALPHCAAVTNRSAVLRLGPGTGNTNRRNATCSDRSSRTASTPAFLHNAANIRFMLRGSIGRPSSVVNTRSVFFQSFPALNFSSNCRFRCWRRIATSCLEKPAFTHDGVPAVTACMWRETSDDQWHHGTIEFPLDDADPDGSTDLFRLLVDRSPEAFQRFAEDTTRGRPGLGSVEGDLGEFGAGEDAELGVGLVEVCADGAGAQEQLGGDVLVGQALRG